MKALVVDDEPDIRLIAEIALRDVAGWDVRSVSDGHEALEAVLGEDFDVILLDVMMPGLDGPATLARLRETPRVGRTPVLFMTAKVQRDEVERFLALGVDGLIAKPFDPMTLSSEVESALARKG